jgi:hypothetical protein
MYLFHSARVSGSPAVAHTAAAAVADPVSQSRTVWSALPAAMTRPPGLNATEYTCPAGPFRSARKNGVELAGVRHSQTVPSVTPAASVCPSGLNAIEYA